MLVVDDDVSMGEFLVARGNGIRTLAVQDRITVDDLPERIVQHERSHV